MEQLQPGQRLGGYEVVSHVKSGGMADLYLGKRLGAAGFSRPVAIKIVHRELARDPKFIRMFLDEARLAVRIQHPNVVRVEELFEAEGTYLMTMEYVHGVSLFELLYTLAKSGRRLAPTLAAWIGVQVADGLNAAHELCDAEGQLLDVVHRDVSPQNVLLSFGGHVKVIDFGIAKSRERADRTRVGVIRGKIGYMSPEQANAGQVDRRTDVYALGIVLWESLTSRRLFKANNEVELLDKVRKPRVPRPSLYGPVPPSLENVVMEALAPPLEMRIPNARVLRDRLLKAMPKAASIHSSMLAGLLTTVMGDKLRHAPVSWAEAGLSGEPARASMGFLEVHTMHASQPDFIALDEEELEMASDTLAGGRPPLGSSPLDDAMTLARGKSPGISTSDAFDPAPATVSSRVRQIPLPPEMSSSTTSGRFSAPPLSMAALSEGLDEIPTMHAPTAVAPPTETKKSRAGGCLVTVFSLAVLAIALVVAAFLLDRAGVVDLPFERIIDADAILPFDGAESNDVEPASGAETQPSAVPPNG